MKNHILNTSSLILSLLLFLTACQKETIEPEDKNQVSSTQTWAETSLLEETVEQEAIYRMDPATPIVNCPKVRWSAPCGTYPNSMVIDYGTGCEGRDGIRYSGQIKLHMTADYYEKGSVLSIRTDNLIMGDKHVAFSREVTNEGFDKNNHMYWLAVANGSRTWDDGGDEVWNSKRIRTWMFGHDSADDLTDDSFAVTGVTKGITREDRAYSGEITTPLVMRTDCRWIVSGIETYTLEGQDGNWKVNFGDGVCDNKALVTLPNGTVEAIVLTGYWP